MIYRRTCLKTYADYGSFKGYIRCDFHYRCVYCHRHEGAFDTYREFQIDHIKPKSILKFKTLASDYSNLVYSCPHCNNIKTASWPSDDPIKDGKGWIDPCQYDFNDHYELKFDGNDIKVVVHTALGNWMIHNLGFDQVARANNIAKWYKRVYKLRSLILKTYRQSKREDLSDDIKIQLIETYKGLLQLFRDMMMPAPYVAFNRPKDG